MSVTRSNALLAKYTRMCKIYGGTASNVGVITWTLVGDMSYLAGTGSFVAMDVEPVNNSLSVRPSDAPINMNLTEYQDYSGWVRELRQGDGSSILQQCAAAYEWVGVVAAYGLPLATALTYLAAIGHLKSAPRGIASGQNLIQMDFDCMGYPHYEGPTLPSYMPTG